MGSLGSRPSVPQTQTVFVPATATPAVTTSTVNQSAADTQAQEQAAEQDVSEARSQSLLGRERGRFGTVTTSFRGLLGLSNNDAKKKTLLGE